MRRKDWIIVILGVLVGVSLIILRVVEYRTIVHDYSLQLYGGVVAVIFVLIGLWLGTSLSGRNANAMARSQSSVSVSVERISTLGLSTRELEVLSLVATGMTNKEISETLFVSENTTKTHLSNIYSKLDVKRRTQAVKKARDLEII